MGRFSRKRRPGDGREVGEGAFEAFEALAEALHLVAHLAHLHGRRDALDAARDEAFDLLLHLPHALADGGLGGAKGLLARADGAFAPPDEVVQEMGGQRGGAAAALLADDLREHLRRHVLARLVVDGLDLLAGPDPPGYLF